MTEDKKEKWQEDFEKDMSYWKDRDSKGYL